MKSRPGVPPILAITMGDPAGVGPEIIVKAVARPGLPSARLVAVGDWTVMEAAAKTFQPGLRLRQITTLEEAVWAPDTLEVLDLANLSPGSWRYGEIQETTGRAAVEYITTAARLALSGQVAGLVTAPIHKGALAAAGYAWPGHTELLAELCGVHEVGMLFVGGPFRVMLATIHVSLQALPALLTRERVAAAIRLLAQTLTRDFGVAQPRLAVAGLNPHASEGGRFGQEEHQVIEPAVHEAVQAGIQATGPLPADTLFVRAARGEFDGVVAMYHDQALIPVKLAAFGRAVNVTVGLPFIRTSVDHGTAFDRAGQGTADPGSLVEALRLAATMVQRRAGGP